MTSLKFCFICYGATGVTSLKFCSSFYGATGVTSLKIVLVFIGWFSLATESGSESES